MIDFAKKCDIDGIIEVWSEAFGESREDILKFLGYYLDYMLVFRTDDVISGITAMLPVSLNGKKGRYIYAVATKKEYRGHGIAGKLVEFVKDFIRQNGESFSVLVPQEKSLFDYYKRFGYETISCLKTVKEIEFTEEIFEVVPVLAEEYESSRKKYFKNLINWDKEDLEKIRSLYNGKFLKVKSVDAIAFVVKNQKELVIKELLVNGNEKTAIKSILEYEKAEKFMAKLPGEEASAMIFPKEFEDVYFNIAID